MTYLIIIILFSLWNGYFIRWQQTKDIKYSKIWHSLGFIIRVLPVIELYPNYELLLIYLNLAWTFYDISINLIIKQSMFYTGTTSWFDKTFGKYLFIPKTILLILTIYYLI